MPITSFSFVTERKQSCRASPAGHNHPTLLLLRRASDHSPNPSPIFEPTEKVHNVKWINNWALLTWLLRKVKLLYIINAKYLCISLIFSTLAKNSAMLGDYQQTRLSEYARIYDILIPRDHIFRRMKSARNWSPNTPLVWDALQKIPSACSST